MNVQSRNKKASGSGNANSRLHMFDFLKPKDDKAENEKQAAAAPAEEEAPASSYSSDDPVEKIFGFFFGEKEEEPMGMKRFGRGT